MVFNRIKREANSHDTNQYENLQFIGYGRHPWTGGFYFGFGFDWKIDEFMVDCRSKQLQENLLKEFIISDKLQLSIEWRRNMYFEHREEMFRQYNAARSALINEPQKLIELEKYVTLMCKHYLRQHYEEFEKDYNEASFLHPFWANYPPDDRGRAPKGDQIPWIEVGEHSIGHKLNRIIAQHNRVREVGIPSGADNRFILSSPILNEITSGLTDSVMAFIDIKSVGPRDDAEHTVISPYQVSGDGIWANVNSSLVNSQMEAVGHRAIHPFFPAISPIYVLSDGVIAPTIHIFIKPVYRMLSLEGNGFMGQPLNHIRIICVPNGLLLTENPNYLNQYPGLFFPGKDDKSKPAQKMRCRVSFDLLSQIDAWRVIEATD